MVPRAPLAAPLRRLKLVVKSTGAPTAARGSVHQSASFHLAMKLGGASGGGVPWMGSATISAGGKRVPRMVSLCVRAPLRWLHRTVRGAPAAWAWRASAARSWTISTGCRGVLALACWFGGSAGASGMACRPAIMASSCAWLGCVVRMHWRN